MKRNPLIAALAVSMFAISAGAVLAAEEAKPVEAGANKPVADAKASVKKQVKKDMKAKAAEAAPAAAAATPAEKK